MDAAQVRTLVGSGVLLSFSVDVHERNGRLVVNEKVALPVKCDVSVSRQADVELFTPEGDAMGVLCFTSVPSALALDKSDYQLAAYLSEQDIGDFSLARPLLHDYVVIEKDCIDEYLEQYAATSAIWGGYAHISESMGIEERAYSGILTAHRGVKLLLPAAEGLCHRAVSAAHPFERFLKHYHQLELIVDWTVARRIARLPPTLAGFDKLMSTYSSSDMNKVKGLLIEYCTEPSAIKSILDQVVDHLEVAEKIFQEFGKSDNPLQNWERAKAGDIPINDALKVAAYWLFRVRCSIAHHRIGEYVLREDDQRFVVDFAEPLLLQVVKQVLGSQRLHSLA